MLVEVEHGFGIRDAEEAIATTLSAQVLRKLVQNLDVVRNITSLMLGNNRHGTEGAAFDDILGIFIAQARCRSIIMYNKESKNVLINLLSDVATFV